MTAALSHPTPAIPLLVELCAGTAALSLRLEQAKVRPPVSRMGAKTGYADIILALAGLQPGGRAERYLWCEPDAGVRLLLHAYTDRALAMAAADIIRSWKDEEPRALWERLRAEGPAVCPPVEPREVARWVLDSHWSRSSSGGSYQGPGARKTPNPNDPNNAVQGERGPLADRTEHTPLVPATIADDARTVPTPPRLPAGTVAYIDPPYKGTTGYAHAFPRSEWLPVVRRWAAAGARCMVSEAEPIPELVADGWHAVEITAMRRGQKRTFSKQKREFVTMNFEPDEAALRSIQVKEQSILTANTEYISDLFGA